MSKRSLFFLVAVSIIVPGLVAYILFSDQKLGTANDWHHALPHLNAVINSATTGLLVLGLIFIRADQQDKHRAAMIGAFILGTLFLVSYLLYHSSVPSTVFGDLNYDGSLDSSEKESLGYWRGVYLTLLLSHIVLAFVVVPLVLLAMFHALREDFDRHLKVVKFAYPIWLYVSISGVLVYFMIRPYYAY